MTKQDDAYIELGIDLHDESGRMLSKEMNIDFARQIEYAFEHEGGFEALAQSVGATVRLGITFKNSAVKAAALRETHNKAAPPRLEGLTGFSYKKETDRAIACNMKGTLSGCLEAAANALGFLGVGVNLARSFEDAQQGTDVNPEIRAFYQWMDRKVNGKIQHNR